ncbi:Serine hydrolase OS=Streptomyces tendae OX=1932 GN=GUR47_35790 PE=4 SV=1 [Streptomyces tendae]
MLVRAEDGGEVGEVHDENAFGLGGVAGHAGAFSSARDLAVLGRTLLNGGSYARARILRPESVELMFTDFDTGFPGDEHGLGVRGCTSTGTWGRWRWRRARPGTPGSRAPRWCWTRRPTRSSSSSATPSTRCAAGVPGRLRGWAAATNLARAVPVRPAHGRTAWFSGTASATTATLTLPALDTSAGRARLRCSLWWDTEPGSDTLVLESTTDGGTSWQPVPFTTTRRGAAPQEHPAGSATGWSGRVWHALSAGLPAARGLTLRWRYTTDRLYVGRGAYVDGLRAEAGGDVLFHDARPADAARVEAVGWSPSAD